MKIFKSAPFRPVYLHLFEYIQVCKNKNGSINVMCDDPTQGETQGSVIRSDSPFRVESRVEI